MATEPTDQIFTKAANAVPPAASWAPQDACTLPSDEQPARFDEFERVFATALEAAERREPTWLRLRFAAGPHVEDQMRDLTRREAECCGFFDFEIVPGDPLILDVRVPPSRSEVLTGLERQASSARAGADGAEANR